MKKYRREAWLLCGVAMRTVQPEITMPFKAATITATFYFPTRHRHDRDNLLASLKSAFDGLADAGIVRNDSAFTYAPVQVFVDPETPRLMVEVLEDKPF